MMLRVQEVAVTTYEFELTAEWIAQLNEMFDDPADYYPADPADWTEADVARYEAEDLVDDFDPHYARRVSESDTVRLCR